MRPPLAPCPDREDFAALVAALRGALATANRLDRIAITAYMNHAPSARPPACFDGRPWTGFLLTLREAAALAGYSHETFRLYARPSARRAGRDMGFPQPSHIPGRRERRWRAGDIAIWAASRDPDRGKAVLTPAQAREALARAAAGEPAAVIAARYGVTRSAIGHLRVKGPGGPVRAGRTPWPRTRPAPPPAPYTPPRGMTDGRTRRAAAVTYLTALIQARPSITWPQAAAEAAAAAVQVPAPGRCMRAARAAATPAVLSGIISSRPGGYAGPPQIAAVFGCSRAAVWTAMRTGEIRAIRAGRLWLADPARLRYRDGYYARATPAVPVDKDHPRAIPAAGDREEGGEAA